MVFKYLCFAVLSLLGISVEARSFSIMSIMRQNGGAQDREVVSLLGYNSENDGGGGDFYWDTASMANDDLGTVIAPSGYPQGRWKRIYTPGAINLLWFGVILNSSGSASFNASRIDQAITVASGLGTPTTLQLPVGDLWTTGGHTPNLKINLVGAGAGKSIIHHTGTNVCFQDLVSSSVRNAFDKQVFRDFSLLGNNSQDAKGLQLGDNEGFTIQRLHIIDYEAGTAINFHNATYFTERWVIEDVKLYNNAVNILFTRTTQPNATSSFAFGRIRNLNMNLAASSKGVLIYQGSSDPEILVYNAFMQVHFQFEGGGAQGFEVRGSNARIDGTHFEVSSDGQPSGDGSDQRIFWARDGGRITDCTGNIEVRNPATMRAITCLDPVYSSDASSNLSIRGARIEASGYGTGDVTINSGYLLPKTAYKVEVSAHGPYIWGKKVYYVGSHDFNRTCYVDKISGSIRNDVIYVQSYGGVPDAYSPDNGQKIQIVIDHQGTNFYYSYSIEQL